MTVLQAIKLNIYTLRTLRSDESAGISRLYAPPTAPRATQTETTSAPPESGWTVTTISLCQIYTTRSLKRDETAGYIRLVRASGENDPDTVMCDAECDGFENDGSPMDSDTYARHPVDDFSD